MQRGEKQVRPGRVAREVRKEIGRAGGRDQRETHPVHSTVERKR
jgi:hypothetical protein